MAKRHIVEYYNKVANQYHDMLLEIQDFTEECNKGLIEPERFDEVKKIIEPLKNNYMAWSYVMYLLNLPNRESKVKNFKRRDKRKYDHKTNTLEENDSVLKDLRNKNNGLKNLR